MRRPLANTLKLLAALVVIVSLLSCSSTPRHALYERSKSHFSGTGYSSFTAYTRATRNWLTENRVAVSDDLNIEIAMNMPFSVSPAGNETSYQTAASHTKGILLVHGLGDSPWSFSDLAQSFADKGFHVRTILLSGHGTRPADLLNARAEDWQTQVSEQVALLKQEVDEVSLGGFSTGANLVTAYAVDDPDIRSLYLFSPAFKSDEPFDFMTPIAASFKDWLYLPDAAKVTNKVRYSTVPLNGFAQYYHTSAAALEKIKDSGFDRPVFIATSQADSVVDVDETLTLFHKYFTHAGSRLAWFGDKPATADDRVSVFAGRVPEHRISNFSHMGLLFSTSNPYYGQRSSYRMCQNGQTDEARVLCERGQSVWYSAWGYQEDDKVHARLTFNPYYSEMVSLLETVIKAADR